MKKYSDLHLAVEGPALSLADRGALVEAFDESALNFKVDVVETSSLDPEFLARIETDKIVLAVAHR